MHVSKPRSCLAPIPFGLGVEMDYVLGSKWAIEELHSLGYSVSYAEVNVFKQSVTKNEDVSEYLKTNLRGSFTQFMCDNVDHNTMTIDGKNSFRAMGLCCATVCRGGGELKLKDAVKREQKKRVADVIKGKEIPIYSYESSINALSKAKFKRFGDLFLPCSNASLAAKLDLMFHFSRFFNDEQPSCSGYMSIHCHGSHN